MTAFGLRPDPQTGFTQVVGIGGIGTGIIFALQENHTLGRNESRMGAVVDARDYCKLHIVEHYIAALIYSAKDLDACKIFAVGNVGADTAGATLLREMTEAGINTLYVRVEPDSRTMFSVSFLYPDSSGGNITACNSAASQLRIDQIEECRPILANAGAHGIALSLPEVPLDKREKFLRVATECESYRVASFASAELKFACESELLANVDLLALNREEAMELADSNLPALNERQILDRCALIATSMNPSMRILMSAGPQGAYVFECGHWSKHPAIPMDAMSTAGAGDALLGGTIAGLIAGMPLTDGNWSSPDRKGAIQTAVDLGLSLAAFSVTSPHTIHPEATLEQLLLFAATRELSIPLNLIQIGTPIRADV